MPPQRFSPCPKDPPEKGEKKRGGWLWEELYFQGDKKKSAGAFPVPPADLNLLTTARYEL
jgi:hypothetical protein